MLLIDRPGEKKESKKQTNIWLREIQHNDCGTSIEVSQHKQTIHIKDKCIRLRILVVSLQYGIDIKNQ